MEIRTRTGQRVGFAVIAAVVIFGSGVLLLRGDAVLGIFSRIGKAMRSWTVGVDAAPDDVHFTDELADALARMPVYDPRWCRVCEEHLARGGRHGYVLDEAILTCNEHFDPMLPGSTHFTIGGPLITVMCAGAGGRGETQYLTQVWVWRQSLGKYQREWMHETGLAQLQAPTG